MKSLLQYKGYFGSAEFSAEDDVLFGQIIAINDVVTYESDSVKGLKNAFKEAVNDYLATCAAVGKTPDKTFKGSFNVRVSRELHRSAAVRAKSMGISLNEYVKRSLSSALAQEPREEYQLQNPKEKG